MESDAESASHSVSLQTATEVRDSLIKYMAEMLRDLPHQHKAFLHLPRYLVGTEWARWEQHADPVPHGHGFRFHTLYQFFASGGGEWHPDIICDRLSALWTIWGWKCIKDQGRSEASPSVEGRSPDGWEFQIIVARNIRSSSLEVTTPEFSAPESCAVTMPFAVTPFGALSLANVWLAYPDLVTW
jgi:hypothetical protein